MSQTTLLYEVGPPQNTYTYIGVAFGTSLNILFIYTTTNGPEPNLKTTESQLLQIIRTSNNPQLPSL